MCAWYARYEMSFPIWLKGIQGIANGEKPEEHKEGQAHVLLPNVWPRQWWVNQCGEDLHLIEPTYFDCNFWVHFRQQLAVFTKILDELMVRLNAGEARHLT